MKSITITITIIHDMNKIHPAADTPPAIYIKMEEDWIIVIVGVGDGIDELIGSWQILSLILFKGTGQVGSNVTKLDPYITLVSFNTHSSIHDTIWVEEIESKLNTWAL